MILVILLWVAAAWMALSALAVIGAVGKPRKTLEPSTAVIATIVQGLIIAVVVTAAIALA